MAKTRIYSPLQITLGAMWGGPLAATCFLAQNFQGLKQPLAARKTLLYGLLASVAVLLILPYLPEDFPSVILPLLYSLASLRIALNHHPSKAAIAASSQYEFQSSWRVLLLGLLLLILFVLLAVGYMLCLDASGLLDLSGET